MSNLAALAETLTQRSAIHAEDVLAMRRLVWGDGAVSPAEAEAVMALNAACAVRSPEWIDYYVEVMVDYVVRQQAPVGYVDEAKAQWLMHWIDRDGRVDSLSELELLVKVVEVAEGAPETLKAYVLRQIETVVTTGEGPTRNGTLDAVGINDAEVALLRRVLFAIAGEGAHTVSQAEAELLFRLKNATKNAANSANWPDLFVKCVGNYLLENGGYQPPSRDDQVKIDAYLAHDHGGLRGFATRVFGRRNLPVLPEVEAETVPDITPAETSWLATQIETDGARDALEQDLLNFIRRERAGV